MTRSYNGDPIDGTEQYITERPYKGPGETVGGSDPDARGTDTTSFGEGSELAERIHTEHILNPSLSASDIADRVGCHRTTAWRVINRNDSYKKDDFDDLSENASRVVWIRAADETKTQRAIADQVGVSEGYVSRILSHNQALVEQARAELEPHLPEAER